ncbi:hypothetical protein HQ520_00250 [bacterium]|nr:hypothetical protein [bacterium]
MNRDQLLETLEKHSIPCFKKDLKDGGTLVIARRGARVLGLFPQGEGSSPTLLWIHPHIEAILAGSLTDWEGDGSGGMGGDRLWVSPEQNYYYENSAGFDGWMCQFQMDPGKYEEVEAREGEVRYRNRFDLRDGLRCTTLKDVTLERTLWVLENPLADRVALKPLLARVGYVGVETREVLELPDQEETPVLCPWGLAQVPSPAAGAGTVVVPTARRARPIGYFGEIPDDRIHVGEDQVCFKIDAQRVTKLGIQAEDINPEGPVRVGYISPLGRPSGSGPAAAMADPGVKWSLIVKESKDVARSSDLALDPAKADPRGPRGVVQSYNNDVSIKAAFGEIEIQYLPVEKDSDGMWRSTVSTRLMGYAGEKSDVVALAQEILGLEDIHLF